MDQTYYGGIPRTAKKKVTFNLLPNSVVTPPLECISPILKRDKELSDKLQSKSPSLPRVEKQGLSLNASRGKINTTRCSSQRKLVHLNITNDDFASSCLKAAQDFVVAKEMITNSRTLKSSTSFTLRSKESLSGTNEIAVTMKRFYTSSSLPEHSYNAPEFKPGTPLLQMVI